MSELVYHCVAWLMNGVRVNRTEAFIENGIPMVRKRRRPWGSVVVWFANRFLALAQSGVCMFVRSEDWIDWEVYCAGLLYPDRASVRIGPGASVTMEKVDGISLRQHIVQHALHVSHLAAAACEFRRVHQISCCRFNGPWSHGDLHLDNCIYVPADGTAVLIDFDVRHEFGAAPRLRHADDLRVFLLELMASMDEHWQPLAKAFLEEYREPSVLNELRQLLVTPRGFTKILWYTRINSSSAGKMDQRMKCLHDMIEQVTSSQQISPTPPPL